MPRRAKVVGSGSGLLDVMFSIPNVGYNGLTSSHINPLRDYHVSTSPGLFPSVWCLEATVVWLHLLLCFR